MVDLRPPAAIRASIGEGGAIFLLMAVADPVRGTERRTRRGSESCGRRGRRGGREMKNGRVPPLSRRMANGGVIVVVGCC